MEYQLRRVFEVRALLCGEDFNSLGLFILEAEGPILVMSK